MREHRQGPPLSDLVDRMETILAAMHNCYATCQDLTHPAMLALSRELDAVIVEIQALLVPASSRSSL